MDNKKVEVVILSGFLGSGKSTLLKELISLEKSKGKRIGVLMNELGDISIDSAIIPKETPFKEMLNGCICCTLQGELSLQLRSMLDENELDTILIESTGAAHPLEVLEACTHPMLVSKVNIHCVFTVVNAKQWLENSLSIKLKKLLVDQVKYADIILINKCDQIGKEQLHEVRDTIRSANPQADISTVTFSKFDPALYEDFSLQTKQNTVNEGKKTHVHHHLHLRTVSFSIEKPINRVSFLRWLENFDGQLYRAKGFIYLEETPGLFLFNYAYGMPMFERYSFDKKYEPVLVFIGEELYHDEIKEEIDQL
ncbi:CobW family GTP-binding protein [Alkalihalobacterium alkalinitrilicum]|uniref:CobW family GTP-binding protein n=1 Tax=Alkalihalobacterium alkalinitrilicum TaxID=427920 RepID=UPI00099575B4|nr:GTP-binding protein [Alkalihalobacterium alkalinitrilicum]